MKLRPDLLIAGLFGGGFVRSGLYNSRGSTPTPRPFPAPRSTPGGFVPVGVLVVGAPVVGFTRAEPRRVLPPPVCFKLRKGRLVRE